MKLLTIPDIHLRSWMIDAAEQLGEKLGVDAYCFLGDYVDDFGREYDLYAYKNTIERLIDFSIMHPNNAFFCMGNHDAAYLWHQEQAGFSVQASWLVKEKLQELIRVSPEFKIIHRIGDFMFMHGGVSVVFVQFLEEKKGRKMEIDELIDCINSLDEKVLWTDCSPLWFRPKFAHPSKRYVGDDLYQVVGHTPVKNICVCQKNIISCDTFSTYRDRNRPYGDQTFLLIDMEEKKWKAIPINNANSTMI